jgi:hypothetical protein
MTDHPNIYAPKKDIDILTPFGPVIGYKKLSTKFIRDLNNHIDDDLPDHSDYLVGKVKQEKRFSDDINKLFINELGSYIFEYYKYCFERARMIPDSLPKDIDYQLSIMNGWFVRQYTGEYNPLHIHTNCSISCVGYLSLPKDFDKEVKEDYKDHHPSHGHIQFSNGSPNWLESSGFVAKPRVGDFYIFPSKLLHCVYPFYSKGERRSFSVNMDVIQMSKKKKEIKPSG